MASRKQAFDPNNEEDPYYRDALLGQMKSPDGSMQSPPFADPMASAPVAAKAPELMPSADAGPAAGPAAAPDYTKRGKFATFNAGADDKYNRPWDQLSERYKMQTILSNFDPSQGITPDVLKALNTTGGGINGATFAGGADKLDAQNLQKWEGFDGRQGIGDIIKGFNDPAMAGKHTWGAWQPDEAGPAAGPAGGVLGMTGQPQIGAIDQLGDLAGGGILQKIQQALAQYMKGNDGQPAR